MSRFQQITLLILALILVAVIALVAVTALKPQAQTTVVVTQTVAVIDSTNAVLTVAAEFAATNPAAIQAFQTGLPQTIAALTRSSP